MSQRLQNHSWVWPTGLCCCSNAAHRLGKYHVLSMVEEVWACCSCCCQGQPPIKQQKLTQDPDSDFPEWLAPCADLHCNLKRLSFIFTEASHQPLIKYKHNTAVLTDTHTYTHTEKWFTIHAAIKALHLERMNQLHSFFPLSKEGKKINYMCCSFHKRKTCS